jgi:hypothetical protein
MAFASTMVWEVRTTGSDSNGGGFDPTSGTPGTDYSQQDSPQITYTDLVIDGTTNTKCTSDGNPFTSAHVGNVINITSGTGFTVQRVQVMSVSGSTATCDKSLGTLSSTGGNGKLGGGLASPGQASALAVSGNTVYVKSGTYTLTSSSNVSGGRLSFGGSQLVGYNTTRSPWNTDGSRPVLQPNSNSMTLVSANNDHVLLINLDLEANSKTLCTAVDSSAWNSWKIVNCKSNGLATGFTMASANLVAYCEVASTTSTNPCIKTGEGSAVIGCYVHDGGGIDVGGTGADAKSCSVIHCIVANMTVAGSATAGISLSSNCVAWNCSVYNLSVTSAPGIKFNSSNDPAWAINCVVSTVNPSSGSGYGFDATGALNGHHLVNCAGYNNKTANVNSTNIPSSQQTGFISCSSDPFNAASSGDFSLSSAASGGKLLLNAGLLGAFPAGLSTGYLSVGAVQPQANIPYSAGGGLLVHPGMTGGCRG